MSFFKTKAIVLKIKKDVYIETKTKDRYFIYTIFSYDFWKIDCLRKFSKKHKNLDLWNIINLEIKTKDEGFYK